VIDQLFYRRCRLSNVKTGIHPCGSVRVTGTPSAPTETAPVRGGRSWGHLRGNGAGAARDVQLQPITSGSPPLISFAHFQVSCGDGPVDYGDSVQLYGSER
jgi:hypothetical protein